MSQPNLPDIDDEFDDAITVDDIRSLRTRLAVYRIFAYLTGILLVVLVCIGVPLKYLKDNDSLVTWTGLPHGWLYMGLLISAFMVGQKARWPWLRLVLIGLAGTVPFLSFVAEYHARKDTLATISHWESEVAAREGRPQL